jgi:hypothetical protein
MKVYAVVGYSTYYPGVDNVIKMFSSLEKAEAFLAAGIDDYNDFHEIIMYEVEE